MGEDLPARDIDLDAALKAFQKEHGVKVIDQTARSGVQFPHPGVRIFQVLRESVQTRPSLRRDLRWRLNAIAWQCSEADDTNRHLAYVAPMLVRPVPGRSQPPGGEFWTGGIAALWPPEYAIG